eukprot:CAMPEP_0114248016 /NCGR_PEP_ID=MMETSP0058-20121206/13336_1 /TAXON_ID=36894 /ORGANISM="Pyramimonas parkeae, CCMP726" /LENGTH=251 /DNA_ID=CAMNT_0001361371 /DNA_START=62 /DNA_END=817 /DNA_ORIENTATION=+
MAEIELDRDPVVGKVDRLVHDHKALVHGLAESVAHFTDLACTFESMRQTSEVDKLRENLLEVLGVQAKLSARAEALESLKTSYQCNMVQTNFQQKLADLTPSADTETVQSSEVFQKFERDVWNVHHRGQAMPGEADADVAELDSTLGDYRNSKCPLSAKHLHDMVDPVEDQERIIYERTSIVAYITKNGPEVICPLHGMTHKVQLKDLRPCTQLVRDRKKRKMAATKGNGLSTQLDSRQKKVKSEDIEAVE